MKTISKHLSNRWVKMVTLLCFLHLQAYAFINYHPLVCPDLGNTSLAELNDRVNFCLGDTATYVATFDGATDPTVTFYWDSNLDGVPDPTEVINTNIQIGLDFRVSIVMSEDNVGGQILAVYEDSDCPDILIRTLLDVPNILACGISIQDPCFCLNNAASPGTGQFSETIIVSDIPGQSWEIIEVEGLFEIGASVPPLPGQAYEVGDFLEVDLVDGTRYYLEGVHVDGLGYNIRVSNGEDTLAITNTCLYPNPEINVLDNYCVNYPPFDFEVTDENFSGTFEVAVNSVPATGFNAADLGPGLHVITYTFFAEPQEPGYPSCEQTRSKVVEIFNDYQGTLSCFSHINVGFNNEGQVIVTPDLVISSNFGCTATFEVNIIGKDDNILTCADANIPQMVEVRDPIRGGVCWSTVLPEDKAPPVFICEDITVSCTIDIFNLPADTLVEVTDNCGIASLFVISQSPIDNPVCDPDYSAAFSRTLRATDAMGNSATCVQTIYLDRPALSDVDFPESMEINGCAFTEDISPGITGFPTIDGVPLGFFCEISAFYNDMIIPLCEGSRLVRRMWQVMDHCGGGSVPFIQEIFIRDAEDPIVECPLDTEVNTDPEQCFATYTVLPPATLTDGCVATEDLNLVIFVNGVPHSVGDEVQLGIGVNSIIYRVNDPCGNFDNCTQLVEVVDNQTPTLVCNAFTAFLDETGEVTIDAEDLIDNSYFDNCSLGDTLIAKMDDPMNFQSALTFGCYEVGPNMLIVQVRDESGNPNTCMLDLTIVDTIPPVVIFCPTDEVVECNIDPIPPLEEPIFEDNCGAQLVIDFQDDIVTGCCETSTITRIWTATDVDGLTAECVQVIEVVDNTPPEILCVSDVTVSLDQNGLGLLTRDEVILSEGDLCCTEDLTFALTRSSFTCDDIDEDITVTATVSDECGNESTCDIDVEVIDELAPVFANFQDTINFFVSDFNECAIGFYNALIETPTAFDNCTNNIVVGRSFSPIQSLCGGPDLGIASRLYTFTASDDEGNVNTCTTVARLIDDIAPVVSCVGTPVELFLDDNGVASISSPDLFVSIIDLCDNNPTLILEDFVFSCGDVGPNEVILQGTDCAGNIGTCSSTVVVIDDIDPIITCPANLIVECLDNGGMPTDPGFTGMASAMDNCGVALIEIFDEVSSGTDCDRIFERTFRAEDQSGNEAFCTQEILIEDNTPPVSTCVDPIEFITVAECNGSDPDIALSAIVDINQALIADCYMDECGNGVLVTNDYMGGSIMMDCEDFGGIINITYTIADDCGNIATTIEVEVSLVDRTGPVFTTVPGDVTFECGDVVPDPNLSVDIIAIDECSAVTNISFEDFTMMTPWLVVSQSGNGSVDISGTPETIIIQGSNTLFTQNITSVVSSAAKSGTLSFDWSYETADMNGPSNDPFGISIDGATTTLTDGGGSMIQSGSESFQIDAGHSIEFFIETLNNQDGQAIVTISNIQFEADDIDCPIVDCFIRRFTAEDACGNLGVAYQLITVEDTEGPNLTCQDVVLTLNADGEATLDPEAGISNASDNCGSELSFNTSQTLFDCSNLMAPTNVTLTVTDACENESNCDILVTVVDEIAPILACPDSVIYYMSDFGGFCGNYLDEIPDPMAFDNCEVVSITRSATPLQGICGGSLIGSRLRLVEFVATDQSSNTVTCEVVLRVIDDVAPILNCEEDFTVNLDADGNGSVDASNLLLDITDNCVNTNPTLNAETFNFDCSNIGSNPILLSGSDCAGNVGFCEVEIIVEDNIGPDLVCISDTILILDNNGLLSITDPEDFVLNITDNCSDNFTVDIERENFDCSDLAGSPFSLEIIVTDEESNSSVCNVNVTIEDQTAPIFTNCTDRSFSLSQFADCSYNELLDPAFFNLSAEDVCDGDVIIATGVLSDQVDFCLDTDNPDLATGIATFETSDLSGNVATCQINWTIENDVPPNLNCETVYQVVLDDVTGEATIGASDIASATYPLAGCFTDPSSWLTLIGQTTFDCSDVGLDIEVLVEAATCGSPVSGCTVAIEVIDPDPVSVVCPSPTTIECGSDIDAFANVFEGEFSAAGTCLANTSFNYSSVLNDCGLGTVTFTFIAESIYGDVDECQVDVDVVQAPGSVFVESMIDWPDDYVSDCPVNLPEPITPQLTGGSIYPIGLPCLDIRDQFIDNILDTVNGCQIRERNWTLTDICTGTSYDHTQIISISLNGTQVISGPSSIQVLNDPGECGAQVNLDPLVVTDCSGDLIIMNDFNANGADASGFYPVGITTVNFTILNGCIDQEPNVYAITIEVVDELAPSLTCGNNVTTTCSEDLDAIVAGINFNATDNCSDLTLDTMLNFNLDACGVGFVAVTFTAADLYNQASCSRIIFVNPDPDFELALSDFDLPDDITLACGEDQTTANTGFPAPNTSLLCTSINISQEDEILVNVPESGCETILRTFTIEDICSGEELEYTQTIVISSSTPNILDGPLSVTVLNDPGECGADLIIDQLTLPACAIDLTVTNDFNQSDDASGFYPVGTTAVNFTVTNACGNENTYSFEITVEDDEDPEVICPMDATVSCQEDLGLFVSTLNFSSSDNCGITNATPSLTIPSLSCGSGSTTVTYTATDVNGNSNSCTLEVTITPVFLQESDIMWPDDYSLACDEDPLDTSITGMPVFDLFCGTPMASFIDSDEVTDMTTGCTTFIRNWTITDACNPSQIFEHPQTISIPNYGDLANLDDMPIMILEVQDPGMCGADVVVEFPVGDFCAEDVVFENSFNSGGADASGFYEVGTTIVTYTISNNCEVLFTMQAIVTVIDLTAPDLDCGIQGSTVVTCADDILDVIANWDIEITEPCPVDTSITLMSNLNDCGVGTVTFNFIVTDNSNNTNVCTRTITVTSDTQVFNETTNVVWPASPLVLEGCDSDIDPLVIGSEPVINGTFLCLNPEISFSDQEIIPTDNPDFCRQFVRTWTITSLCDDAILASFAQTIYLESDGTPIIIDGFVKTPDEVGVSNVDISASDGNRSSSASRSQSDGSFRLRTTIGSRGLVVTPHKNDEALLGLSSMDLLSIARHLHGIQPLTSPYNIIAADANRDKRITIRDIIVLRDLLLGRINDLPEGNWRFVDKAYTFSNPLKPLQEAFTEEIDIPYTDAERVEADFVGIKMGDAFQSGRSIDGRQTSEYHAIHTDEVVFRPGESLQVPLRLEAYEDVATFQIAIRFDPAVIRLVNLQPGTALSEQHINAKHADLGIILISWDYLGSGTFRGSEIMTLQFIAESDGALSNALSITEYFIKPELYLMESTALKIPALVFDRKVNQTDVFELFQNQPNPFSDFTKIQFSIPESDDVSLTVYDISGKVVHFEEAFFNAGMNTFILNNKLAQLPNGTYFYRIKTSNYSATKKMVYSTAGTK